MGSQTSKDGGSGGSANDDPCSVPFQKGNAFKLAMKVIANRNGVTLGGSRHEGYFGGRDFDSDPARSLREYEASISARAKEDVIRRLARALKRAGVEVDPEGDADTIVDALVAQIPNPKNGKTFANDAKAHHKVCSVIADVLNDEFTPGVTKASEKFIDTSVGPVEMCRSVGEWAHSFAAGVNVEFLAVHASVKNSLRAIQILDEVMAKAYATITKKVDGTKNSRLSREVEPLNALYTRAQNERRAQEELLKNILNVQLAPAAMALELAMRDESEQNALVKRLGLRPGTVEFGDSLAMAISGLGTAASIAQRVHKALKTVGASITQYLESSEFSDFRKMVDDKLEDRKIPFEELAEFVKAVEELGSAFSHRKESRFRAALEEAGKTGGKRGGKGLDDSDSDEDSDNEEDSSVVKRAKKQRREKKIILHDFAKRMSRNYDEMLSAVKAMGPKLGKEIPLSDRMDVLRDALVRLSDLRKEAVRLELSLVGYYIDASSRTLKEQFINALRFISSACAAVMGLETYRSSSPDFARLKAAIDGIEKTVDFFADVFANKYGRYGVGGEADDAAVGGGVDDLLPNISRNAISLTEAVNEFAYFYYVAKVRTNLDQTAAEIDSYSENYVELLGHAVAARIYNLETERNKILSRFGDKERVDHSGADEHGHAAEFGNIKAAEQTEPQLTKMANTMQWIREEYATKIRFYKALQAIDLYMKAFTAGIVKDPDAVRDIKKMIDGTQANARWFNENTGDSICKAFELMGSTVDAAGGVRPNAPVGAATLGITGHDDKHYYAKLSALCSDGASIDGVPPLSGGAAVDLADLSFNVGVPIISASIDANASPGIKARKHVSDAVDHFQALKNIINAFARIGDKFGGRELRAQVFMSPTQIYKTLVEYLKVSALSINRLKGVADHNVPPSISTTNPVTGVSANAINDAVRKYQVFFGTIGVPATVAPAEVGALEGNYAIEDRFFALAIKAMAAKLLTTLGVYDMFERTTPIYDLTPTRMIVGGGGGESNVEVLDGATELYFRLPRLAEFYHLLRWDGEEEHFKIAMLPELEGVFSELIRLVFLKDKIEDSIEYSDNDMRIMIREINSIYTHFRDKHDSSQACQEAILAFVIEINRRYGVVKNTDMKKYWKMVRMSRTGSTIPLNDTNYEILPGEDNTEFERRAPSDNYAVEDIQYQPGTLKRLNPQTGNPADAFIAVSRRNANIPTNWGATNNSREMLRKFRKMVEKELSSVPRNEFRKVSYSLLIRQAQSEIKSTSSADKKLEVVFKLFKGTSLATTDSFKGYMFHETVVLGLNSLSAVETLLQKFNEKITHMNPQHIENEIMDRVYARLMLNTGAGGGGAPAVILAGVTGDANIDNYDDTNIEALFNEAIDATWYMPFFKFKGDQYAKFRRYLTREDAPHNQRSGLHHTTTHRAFREFMLMAAAGDASNAAQWRAMNGAGDNPATYARAMLPYPPSYFNTVDSPIDGTVVPNPAGDEIAGCRLRDGSFRMNASQASFLRALRLYARFSVDYKMIMQDYVENLFAIMGGMPIGQAGQRLVDVKFIPGSSDETLDGSVQVGFSKLRDVAETILNEVKAYIDKFRPYVSKDVLERFENPKIPGSVPWIEEHLVDRFFKGSFDGRAMDRKRMAENTLDGIARKTADVLKQLGRLTHVSTKGLDIATLAATIVNWAGLQVRINGAWLLDGIKPHESRREDFGQALSALIFYDSTSIDPMGDFTGWQPDFNGAAPSVTSRFDAVAGVNASGGAQNGFPVLGDLIAMPGAPGAGATRQRVFASNNTAEASRLLIYKEVLTDYRSLLFSFNQFMAQYLATLKYVENGPRFYTNLINTFVNGAWAESVDTPQGNTWPDLVDATTPADVHIGIRGDPKERCILFQSLAYILQRIKTDTVSAQLNLPKHLVATLSEVPLHAKESYRANLPGFIKLFGFLHEKCIFIKQLMENKCISLKRPSQLTTNDELVTDVVSGAFVNGQQIWVNALQTNVQLIAVYPPNALTALYPLEGNQSSEKMKKRLGGIVDMITYAANTMRNAASEVLKELGDNPVYFETQEGSIEAYKVSYGNPPLMPLSLSTWFLNNLSKTDPFGGSPDHLVGHYSIDTKIYPKFSLGAPDFKLQYGVRQLLARSTTLSYDQIPGVKAALDEYNASSLSHEAIDGMKHLAYVDSIITLLRFAVDCRNYKPMAASTNYLFSTEDLLVDNPSYGLKPTDNHDLTTVVWPLFGALRTPKNESGCTINDIISVVEGAIQDDAIAKITRMVSGAPRSNTRKQQRVYNLIDMNIVPINVHALMRDMPLANLYNYEYTFEQMVASMLGEQTAQFNIAWAEGGLPDDETVNTRLMFLRLLNNPYIEVSPSLYGTGITNSKSFIHRIFRGDNSLGMGRPKFLSDQLFNKALFGGIYQGRDDSRNDFDEGGPGVGAGHYRGSKIDILSIFADAAMEIERIRSTVTTDLANHLYNTRADITYYQGVLANGAGHDPAQTDTHFETLLAQFRTGHPDQAYRLIIPGTVNAYDGCGAGPLDNSKTDLAEKVQNYIDSNALAQLRQSLLGVGQACQEYYRLYGNTATATVDVTIIRNILAAAQAAAALINVDAFRTRVNNVARATAYAAAAEPAVQALGNGGGGLRDLLRATRNGANAARVKIISGENDVGTSYLTYLGIREPRQEPHTVIKQVSVGTLANRRRLEAIGKLRFDTFFVRKLFFITNVARIIRLKLNRELTQSRSVLPTSHMSVTPGITEYDLDPFAPNEVYASRIGDGYDYDNMVDRPDLANETGSRRGMTRFADEMRGI